MSKIIIKHLCFVQQKKTTIDCNSSEDNFAIFFIHVCNFYSFVIRSVIVECNKHTRYSFYRIKVQVALAEKHKDFPKSQRKKGMKWSWIAILFQLMYFLISSTDCLYVALSVRLLTISKVQFVLSLCL